MSDIVTPAIPQKLIDFLHSYRLFLIAGHKEPDGDCIGSSIALSLFLQRLGKETILLSAGPFKRPEIRQYESLFSSQVPLSLRKQPEETGVIIVDCSGIDRRLGGTAREFPFYLYRPSCNKYGKRGGIACICGRSFCNVCHSKYH